MPTNLTASAEASAVQDAKRLLRLSRTGALATLDGEFPLTTLVGVASDWDGAPLFLMSNLSRHTHNLTANDRASLLLTSTVVKGDPLNNPRLTLNGRVVVSDSPAARNRYVRRNPKAKLYIDFTDFSVRRLQIEHVHFNGGFGRADRLTVADLLTPAGDFTTLAAQEDELMGEVASLDQASLARLVDGASAREAWRPIGIDAEGLELSSGGELVRVDFPEPAWEPTAWRLALRRRLETARSAS